MLSGSKLGTHAERYRRAKKWRAFRSFIHGINSRVFDFGTRLIWGKDGFKYHGATHLIADLFYIDCHVCIFWRGVTVGAFISFVLFISALMIF